MRQPFPTFFTSWYTWFEKTLRLLEIAAMKLDRSRLKSLGTGVGPREAEHLKAVPE
jgi:hypothetical protein